MTYNIDNKTYDTMTYDVMTNDIMTYDVITYDIMKYDVMQFDIMAYDIMKYDVMKYDIVTYDAVLHDVIYGFKKNLLHAAYFYHWRLLLLTISIKYLCSSFCVVLQNIINLNFCADRVYFLWYEAQKARYNLCSPSKTILLRPHFIIIIFQSITAKTD